jgi:hypothetical protein
MANLSETTLKSNIKRIRILWGFMQSDIIERTGEASYYKMESTPNYGVSKKVEEWFSDNTGIKIQDLRNRNIENSEIPLIPLNPLSEKKTANNLVNSKLRIRA